MRKIMLFRILLPMNALLLSSLACGGTNPEPKAPTLPIAPIAVGNDLTQIDICQAIPPEDIEAVMGLKLAKPPEQFEYFDSAGTSGCWYKAEKGADGEAHFGYIALTPIEVNYSQPLYQDEDVFDIGTEAYFNNGAAARELWVRIEDKAAFVVAFGDVPNEEGCKAIARLLAAAIK